MSAISCIGSKAPYTVVPAVAFTKRGMYPYNKNRSIKYKNLTSFRKKKGEIHFRNFAISFSSQKKKCCFYVNVHIGNSRN